MEKGKIYTALYESEIIRENCKVPANNCSAISFELLGTTEATIDNVIPLTASKIREFNELPYVTIVKDFPITFAAGEDTQILVVRTFYKEG